MISIVTAYYNRKQLFYETLKSIAKSSYKDIECIAVDDASDEEERIEDLCEEFSFLKVIRIEPEDKWYFNACIPFNIGIRKAEGDIIMLQNPECLHVHDVLQYVAKTVNKRNYITISAYQIGKKGTKILPKIINDGNLLNHFKSLPQQGWTPETEMGWYNHPKYKPTAYHFCSAMTKKNMIRFGGFDERFALGIAYEDTEFIYRIRKRRLRVMIVNEVSVIHQWHYCTSVQFENHKRLLRKNANLLREITTKRHAN